MHKIPELSKLSIIKPTRNLIKDIVVFSKNMPKEYKLTCGKILVEDSMELLNAISLANLESNNTIKASNIRSVIRLASKIEVHLTILSDLKLLGTKQEASFAVLLTDIKSQSTNWYNKIISLSSDQE